MWTHLALIFSAIWSCQALAASDDIARYICGSGASDGLFFYGETWRGTRTIDGSICPDVVYSVV